MASLHRSQTNISAPHNDNLFVWKKIWIALTVSVFLGTGSNALQLRQITAGAPTINDFDWNTISPSDSLQWSTCYSRFQCTKLSVPLDYSEPDGEKAAIAMIRLPSSLHPNETNYRGPILFNPGGPGGSGVELVFENADALRVIGDEFDYLGFDPRGVGRTLPKLDIFSSRAESIILNSKLLDSMNSTASSLGTLFGYAQIIGNLTLNRAKNNAEHISTPEVARDMMSIVKAHGLDKLQYWGFSYGTVLGATFASMFPDNVGRLIIDGVENANSYYQNSASSNDFLVDTDANLFSFYNECFKAGPSACPIYEPTAQQIHQRVDSLLERLKLTPVPFVNATDGSNAVVDYPLTKNVLFTMLYAPYTTGALFANAFAALEAGNAEPMWRMSIGALSQALINTSCGPEVNNMLENVHVELAIGCGDGAPVNDGLDDLKDYFLNLTKQSYFADLWNVRVGCAGWKIQAKEKFQGSFIVNTSFPILLIGNTADPVTPLQNAFKMAAGFSGSVVLHQNSAGHSSIAATSVCTAGVIKNYFRNGTLPENGTVCEIESSIFGTNPTTGNDLRERSYNEEELALFEASRKLQRINRWVV